MNEKSAAQKVVSSIPLREALIGEMYLQGAAVALGRPLNEQEEAKLMDEFKNALKRSFENQYELAAEYLRNENEQRLG